MQQPPLLRKIVNSMNSNRPPPPPHTSQLPTQTIYTHIHTFPSQQPFPPSILSFFFHFFILTFPHFFFPF